MVLRKKKLWGSIYIIHKERGCMDNSIHKQQSLTQHDVDYLKQTGRFTFELMREEI